MEGSFTLVYFIFTKIPLLKFYTTGNVKPSYVVSKLSVLSLEFVCLSKSPKMWSFAI